MKTKKNKKHFNIILFVIIAFIALSLFFAYSQTQFNRTVQNNPGKVETEVLDGLSNALKINATPRDYVYDNWVDKNDVSLPLKGKQVVIGTNGTNGVGKYGNITTDQLNKVTATFLLPLQKKISDYFMSKGFVENKVNTNLIPNEIYFSTVGYQKDSLYCLSHLAQTSDPFAYITCGTIDQNQISLQKELEIVYKEQQKNDSKNDITFRVNKVDEDFANGSAFSVGGWQWIAKKINGRWTTIWSGQDFPICSDMAKYKVPSTMYPGCYNTTLQKVQKSYQDPTELN